MAKTEASKSFLPKVATLELTYRCNHQCLFCSCPWEANKEYKEPELRFDKWREAIDILIQNGVQSLTLSGGEPLVRSDLKDIIRYIDSLGVPMVMISNGRELDDEFLNFISNYNILLCISVPGINTFKEHTGVDNLPYVLRLFETAKKIGVQTSANIAVTKKNLPELYENIALPLIHGAGYILLNRFLPGGRGLDHAEYLLSADETNEMLDVAEAVLKKANKYGHVGTELPLCAIKEPEKYLHIQVSSLCAAGKDFFVVDPSGYVKVCNHSPKRLCKYNEVSDLSKNPYWNAFRYREYLPDMCKDCGKKDICDGGCREAAHVYYGRINDQDPIFESNN